MRVVLDLERFHNVGSHCLTTAIRTLFAQKGIDFQEEIILGLGSGLGFTYVGSRMGSYSEAAAVILRLIYPIRWV